MPRRRKAARAYRNPDRKEKTVSEMTNEELAEARIRSRRERGPNNPDEDSGWKAFFLSVTVRSQQDRRMRAEAEERLMSEDRIEQWAQWRGEPASNLVAHVRWLYSQAHPEARKQEELALVKD